MSQEKSNPTRGRAKRPKKPTGKVIKGKGLDYAAAAHKASRGATLSNIARAAGSRAKPKNLPSVGLRIVKVLKARGEVFEEFTRKGYGIDRFVSQVIEQTEALKTTRVVFEGTVTESFDDIDWNARASARAQYMRAIGLDELPPLVDGAAPGILSGLDDDALEKELGAALARAAAETAPGGGGEPAA